MNIPDDGTSRRILADIADRHPGLTDADLGRWCGLDRSLVGHWRSGDRAMPVWALGRMIRRLPMPVAALEDLSESAADLQRDLRRATADGRVDGDEARDLQRSSRHRSPQGVHLLRELVQTAPTTSMWPPCATISPAAA